MLLHVNQNQHVTTFLYRYVQHYFRQMMTFCFTKVLETLYKRSQSLPNLFDSDINAERLEVMSLNGHKTILLRLKRKLITDLRLRSVQVIQALRSFHTPRPSSDV